MLTCGVWVKRGVAKEIPDKVELTKEDLNKLLEETKEKLRDAGETSDIAELEELHEKALNCSDDDEDIDDLGLHKKVANSKVEVQPDEYGDDDQAIAAEYGLEDYDREGVMMTGAGMAGLMYFENDDDDPYVDVKKIEDEEREDFVIKREDNLFVVGKMEEDSSILEVYVYNEEEDSLYVHHDIILESFPLCLEWLSYDAALEGKSGNYVAVGSMEPSIEVWDLDVVDTLEPAFALEGKKKPRGKKGKSTSSGDIGGHTDAVLGLSWNRHAKNILASSSADKTVRLWDMTQCKCEHVLTHHRDKVQCVAWHPYELQSLLTGSFDRSAAVLDCRSPEARKTWSLSGDCEQAVWDQFSPFNFFTSCDNGVVCYHDVRTDSPVFTLHAHDGSVTGLSLSSQVPGCLTTVSSDKILKVWDYSTGKPTCVLSREMKMGRLHFVACCPDVPFTFGIGGEKEGLRMLDVMNTTAGKEQFGHRKIVTVKTVSHRENEAESGVSMEADATVDAMSTMTLERKCESKRQPEIVKRKKKKKKKKSAM